MAELTIVYWRDMPAQVIARAGRRAAKAELPKRFMEAIDAAAMRAGATDSDAYLADWRRGEPAPCGDDIDQAVKEAIAALDAEYHADRLRQLIDSGGRDTLPA
jgi:hypothetical protein